MKLFSLRLPTLSQGFLLFLAGTVMAGYAFASTQNMPEAQPLIELQAGADPWPPYVDEQLPGGGLAVEIANAALRTQGYKVVNTILPWSRALADTKSGRLDLILDAWWTEERSEHFMFSRPFLDGPVRFIKRKGDPFEFNGIGSLKGKTIAVVRDYGYPSEFLRGANYQLFEVTDFLQAVQMLIKERVDLAVENHLVAHTRIGRELPDHLPKIRFSTEQLSNNYLYVISGYRNPRHAELIHAFNQGLQQILESGEYARILSERNMPVPDMFANTP